MSESLKFGPEWLRNTLSTSPTKQDDTICRPVLSENRYSREEMLSFCESSIFKPDPHATCAKVFNSQWQTPLSFQQEEREKERPPPSTNTGQSRLFLNSNLKHNGGSSNASHNWRKNHEEKTNENWRTQKDPGGTGVFFNNAYNDQNRKTSWRNPENTFENLLEQQKTPPTKYPEGPIVTNKSPAPFISPMNKEFLEYHQQSQDNVKNYFENQLPQLQQQQAMKAEKANKIELATVRKLFEPAQKKTAGGSKHQQQQFHQSKEAELEARDEIDENMKKLEVDLVKNLTDLVLNAETDFHKGTPEPQMQMPMPFIPMPMPSTSSACSSMSISDRPPILWFYVDPHGKVQGPFTEEEMTLWYQNNFFHENLMVKRSFDNNFIPLRTLIGAYGTAHPFTVASNYFPIPVIENYFDQFHPSQSIQQQQNQHSALNMDFFNQMPPPYNSINNFMSNPPPPKQPLHQPQQVNLHMNFLAQPFPTINKPPLPPSNNTPNYQQVERRKNSAAFPPLNSAFEMNNPINFPPPPKPVLQQPSHSSMFKMNQPQFMQPGMNNSSACNMDSIQKMLFDIQKQHEMQIHQQKLNFFPPQQQQQQTFAQTNRQTIPSANQMNNFSKAPAPIQRRPNEKIINFDADDEGDFQKVENPRKKRFQNEEETIKGSEKAKNYATEPPKIAPAPIGSMKLTGETSKQSLKNVTVVEEKSNQPAMPAPWFNKVVVSQNDDKSVNNIQFTFAETSSIQPVAWPNIASTKNEDGKKKRHTIANANAEEGMMNNQSSLPAPWLNKAVQNQNDEKSLKQIQEEEEMRQFKIKLQMKREKDKKEMMELKQKEIIKQVWKPIEAERSSNSLENPRAWGENPQLPKKKERKANEGENEVLTLDDWCVETLKKMSVPYIDIHAFSNFLRSIESPYEIEDYIKAYLGDNMQSSDFFKKYLNYRSIFHNSTRTSNQQADDDLCAPAKAINPPPASTSSAASSINGEENKEQKKKKTKELLPKKSKKTMKFVDANILGFKGAADPNRIVGELEKLTHSDD